MKKVIILFSMGGPDSPQAVTPFLFNLFKDPAILGLWPLFRHLLAGIMALSRTAAAKKNYYKIGGASPLLANTKKQAQALEEKTGIPCLVGMRYWHPFIESAIEEAKKRNPEEIVLLPLYPQYSTTTTASVLKEAEKQIKRQKISARIKKIDSFQTEKGFIEALSEKTKPFLEEAKKFGAPKLLLTAHGLPQRVVDQGDPYETQCKQTAEAFVQKLGAACPADWELCYQSRVGPLKWIGPATDEEIKKAARAARPLVVVPIAFVCEHAETLVELDMLYRERALQEGCPFFGLVPTVQTNPLFIEGLARLVN